VTPARLDTQGDLDAGATALARLDPVMARLLAEGAHPPLRRRPAGFEGLAAIVVGQQLSTASAAAIWGRVRALLPEFGAAAFAVLPDETLRAAGLSAGKVRTLRAIAQAIAGGGLALEALHTLEADASHARLVALPGVGPWTADVYLLFCLGHADAFPAGDLALQEAARIAYGLPARPDPAALRAQAEAWRPWRGVAAGVLWAYYRLAKAREGAPVAAR
jgi:DNA-3-methyladenine glycosylase II